LRSKVKEISADKNVRRKETWFEFLFSCISCWLLSVGICLLLDAQFEKEVGIGAIIWQSLVAIVLIALVTRRWWIVLIYAGTLLLTLAVMFFATDKLGYIFSQAKDFFNWWFDMLPEDSKWYTGKGFYIIHTIINFGVTFGIFALERITRKTWPMAVVVLGTIFGVYIFGFAEYNMLAIPFMFVGFFPLLSMAKFQGHRLFSKKNLSDIVGNRWLIIILSSSICLAISLASVYFIGGNEKLDLRNRYCSDKASDVQTVANFYTTEQQNLRVTLRSLGLQKEKDYIGGRLFAIKPRVIATTDLEETALLKVTSFDKFDGKLWSDTFEKKYRVNGPWPEKQISYLNGNITQDDFLFTKARMMAKQRDITITLKEARRFLPTMGQTLNFTEITPTKNSIMFDSRGQVLSYYELNEGYSYTINSMLYQTGTSLNNNTKNSLKEIVKSTNDPQYTEEFVAHYTEPIGELPKKAQTAIDMMDIDPENHYDTAYKIANYFSKKNGFSYTKNPGKFTAEDDIVDKLFETRTGHCLYYSTAMIAMTRSMGIPSRLVAGYRTVEGKNGVQVIDVSSPYAWVECYIPNMGWITYDPAPNTAASLINTPYIEEEGKEGENKDEEPELTIPDEPKEEEIEEVVPVKKDMTLVWILIGCAGFIVLAIIGYLVARSYFAPNMHKLPSVQKRYRSTKKQAEFYWQDLLRQYKCMGYKLKKSETIEDITQRACSELIYRNEDVIFDAVKAIQALHYADISPTDEDVAKLATACEMMDAEAKWKLKPIPYYFKRRMFLPIRCRQLKKYEDDLPKMEDYFK